MFMYIISNLQLCCYEPHQNQHDTRTFFSDNVSYVCFTNFEQIFRGVSRTLPNNYDVTFPASAYLLKVNNRNTRTRCCLFAGWVCAKMSSGWRLLTVFAKKTIDVWQGTKHDSEWFSFRSDSVDFFVEWYCFLQFLEIHKSVKKWIQLLIFLFVFERVNDLAWKSDLVKIVGKQLELKHNLIHS